VCVAAAVLLLALGQSHISFAQDCKRVEFNYTQSWQDFVYVDPSELAPILQTCFPGADWLDDITWCGDLGPVHGTINGDFFGCGGEDRFYLYDPHNTGFYTGDHYFNPVIIKSRKGTLCLIENSTSTLDPMLPVSWFGVGLEQVVGGTGAYENARGWFAFVPYGNGVFSTGIGWLCTPSMRRSMTERDRFREAGRRGTDAELEESDPQH
jgi:hypothetical protein